MRVSKSQPVYPTNNENGGWGSQCGIPLRLEIATRIAQGLLANHQTYASGLNFDRHIFSEKALSMADALIDTHNQDYGCNGE